MKRTLVKIAVSDGNGGRGYVPAEVQAVKVLGVWAAHVRPDTEITKRTPPARRYKVSHLPSGFSINVPCSRAQAVKLVEYMHASCPDLLAGAPFGVQPTGEQIAPAAEAYRAYDKEFDKTYPREAVS
jgi:hypothetical protein